MMKLATLFLAGLSFDVRAVQGIFLPSRSALQPEFARGEGILHPVRFPSTPTALRDVLPETTMSCTDGRESDRTCRMQGVCYDTQTEQFLWNSPSNAAPGFDGSWRAFSLDGGTHTYLDLVPTPDVLVSNLETDSPGIAMFKGVTALFGRRNAPENAGHLLIQTAYAMERLANDYNVTTTRSRMQVLLGDCPDTTPENRHLCNKFTDTFLRPVSDNILSLSDLKLRESHRAVNDTRADNFRFLCFDDVLGGLAQIDPFHHSWKQENASQWIRPYKEKLYSFWHIPFPKRKLDECNLIFTMKRAAAGHGLHPLDVANIDAIDEFLTQWSSKHGVKYRGFDLGEVDFETQLSELANANIHLTVPGSTAFSSHFLAEGSDVVYLDKKNYEWSSGIEPDFDNHVSTINQIIENELQIFGDRDRSKVKLELNAAQMFVSMFESLGELNISYTMLRRQKRRIDLNELEETLNTIATKRQCFNMH